MTDYRNRSYKKELLDGNGISFKDIAQNMRELNYINTHLGGHSITIKGFKQIAGDEKNVSVCEIGCGGGDNIAAIYNFCKRKCINAAFTGIDINTDCISYAKQALILQKVSFIVSDYKLIDFKHNKPDIIFSSLFCHHFTDEELVKMLQWMNNNSAKGFFINDLHRNPIAYNFIKAATKIFSSSYLVKNDAPLSVLRGFKKKEWKTLMVKAGVINYSVKWKWAFRFLITAHSASNA